MQAENTPCPSCGEKKLRIEMRFEAVERFSLSGSSMKLSVREWPWLVCDGCGIEARGSID